MFKNDRNVLFTRQSSSKSRSRHKRRRLAKSDASQPFPVMMKMTEESPPISFNCRIHQGFINHESRCVTIRDQQSRDALYRFGYFGKGSKSRNSPIYDTITSFVNDPIKKQHKNKLSKRQHETLRRCFPVIPAKECLINELYDGRQVSDTDDSDFEGIDVNFSARKFIANDDHETEDLHLAFDEAWFLCFSLGVLDVFDGDEKLSIETTWRRFCDLRNPSDATDFIALYAVYHYYRAKGWIVKSGTIYGSNLMIYKEGPGLYHSLFSVVVLRNSAEEQTKFMPELNWQHLIALNRVTEGVKKNFVLCHVLFPRDLGQDELKSPLVISKLGIKNVLMTRFNPGSAREES